VDPSDTALIESDTVYTGNGTHHPGIAYTALQYLSQATNEWVQITARTAGDHNTGVSIQVPYQLPLLSPATITLYCIPGSWHFLANPGPCMILCRSLVRDAHQQFINGSLVVYNPSRGRLYTLQTGGTESYQRYTGPTLGPSDANPGETYLWLRETTQYIFPNADQMEITGEVAVEVQGHSEATDSQILNFRRGNGG